MVVNADSWNTKDDLAGSLPQTTNLDTVDVAKILERAHRRVVDKFGKHVEERLYPDVEDQLEYKLRFSRLLEFNKAQRFDEEIDSSNYTVDKDDGKITFTSSYQADKLANRSTWRVTVEYVPYVFVDLELLYAQIEYLSLTVVQIDDDSEENKLDKLRELARMREKEINRNIPPPDLDRGQTLGAKNRRSTDL